MYGTATSLGVPRVHQITGRPVTVNALDLTNGHLRHGQTIAERTGKGDAEFLDGDQRNTMDAVYDPTSVSSTMGSGTSSTARGPISTGSSTTRSTLRPGSPASARATSTPDG